MSTDNCCNFVFGIGPTQSMITLLNGSSNAGTGFNGAGFHSDLIYQPFDTHDKFSPFFSIVANRSAVKFYPHSRLHPSDHSWVNYGPIHISLTCTLKVQQFTCVHTPFICPRNVRRSVLPHQDTIFHKITHRYLIYLLN